VTHSDINPRACLEKAFTEWTNKPNPLKTESYEITINGTQIEVYTFIKYVPGGFIENYENELIRLVEATILQEQFKEEDDEISTLPEQKNENKEKVPSLKDMGDIDIERYIESIWREPTSEECDIWKFDYNPEDPSLHKFSYGTFRDCTIPARSFCFTEKNPLTIISANFTNVDFGKCIFEHVIFLGCSFTNCEFSNTVIQDLTFHSCIIVDTNIDYPDVFIEGKSKSVPLWMVMKKEIYKKI